jgi:hypothetical protein
VAFLDMLTVIRCADFQEISRVQNATDAVLSRCRKYNSIAERIQLLEERCLRAQERLEALREHERRPVVEQ